MYEKDRKKEKNQCAFFMLQKMLDLLGFYNYLRGRFAYNSTSDLK